MQVDQHIFFFLLVESLDYHDVRLVPFKKVTARTIKCSVQHWLIIGNLGSSWINFFVRGWQSFCPIHLGPVCLFWGWTINPRGPYVLGLVEILAVRISYSKKCFRYEIPQKTCYVQFMGDVVLLIWSLLVRSLMGFLGLWGWMSPHYLSTQTSMSFRNLIVLCLLFVCYIEYLRVV